MTTLKDVLVACCCTKERPHMAVALDPVHVPPRSWHTIGLDFLTHLPASVCFDIVLVIIDLLTQMAHFFL
jgi:hypothetical protein